MWVIENVEENDFELARSESCFGLKIKNKAMPIKKMPKIASKLLRGMEAVVNTPKIAPGIAAAANSRPDL